MSDLIRLDAVSRRFTLGGSEVAALDRVSLRVAEGEYLAVMGPSGSGKSTLLNVLGLLDRPDEGRYWLGGEDTATLSEPALAQLRGHRIGFVFQSFHLISRLTARENVELPLMLCGIAPAERHLRSQQLLGELGLENRAGHRPAELSGGQRQRVAIARAMAMAPRLILADEPTGNLDSRSGEEVITLLEGLNREQGITLVVVTHDPRLGERAGRRILMNDGRISTDSIDSTNSDGG
ncbi:ABC transporter ATP-binding protein [Aeromonas veronii]